MIIDGFDNNDLESILEQLPKHYHNDGIDDIGHQYFVRGMEYICLWRAVMLRMISDLLSPSSKKAYKEAVKWYQEDLRDFDDICEMAFIDPTRLREVINKLLVLRLADINK